MTEESYTDTFEVHNAFVWEILNLIQQTWV